MKVKSPPAPLPPQAKTATKGADRSFPGVADLLDQISSAIQRRQAVPLQNYFADYNDIKSRYNHVVTAVVELDREYKDVIRRKEAQWYAEITELKGKLAYLEEEGPGELEKKNNDGNKIGAQAVELEKAHATIDQLRATLNGLDELKNQLAHSRTTIQRQERELIAARQDAAAGSRQQIGAEERKAIFDEGAAVARRQLAADLEKYNALLGANAYFVETFGSDSQDLLINVAASRADQLLRGAIVCSSSAFRDKEARDAKETKQLVDENESLNDGHEEATAELKSAFEKTNKMYEEVQRLRAQIAGSPGDSKAAAAKEPMLTPASAILPKIHIIDHMPRSEMPAVTAVQVVVDVKDLQTYSKLQLDRMFSQATKQLTNNIQRVSEVEADSRTKIATCNRRLNETAASLQSVTDEKRQLEEKLNRADAALRAVPDFKATEEELVKARQAYFQTETARQLEKAVFRTATAANKDKLPIKIRGACKVIATEVDEQKLINSSSFVLMDPALLSTIVTEMAAEEKELSRQVQAERTKATEAAAASAEIKSLPFMTALDLDLTEAAVLSSLKPAPVDRAEVSTHEIQEAFMAQVLKAQNRAKDAQRRALEESTASLQRQVAELRLAEEVLQRQLAVVVYAKDQAESEADSKAQLLDLEQQKVRELARHADASADIEAKTTAALRVVDEHLQAERQKVQTADSRIREFAGRLDVQTSKTGRALYIVRALAQGTTDPAELLKEADLMKDFDDGEKKGVMTQLEVLRAQVETLSEKARESDLLQEEKVKQIEQIDLLKSALVTALHEWSTMNTRLQKMFDVEHRLVRAEQKSGRTLAIADTTFESDTLRQLSFLLQGGNAPSPLPEIAAVVDLDAKIAKLPVVPPEQLVDDVQRVLAAIKRDHDASVEQIANWENQNRSVTSIRSATRSAGVRVPQRRNLPVIDPVFGAELFKTSGKSAMVIVATDDSSDDDDDDEKEQQADFVLVPTFTATASSDYISFIEVHDWLERGNWDLTELVDKCGATDSPHIKWGDLFTDVTESFVLRTRVLPAIAATEALRCPDYDELLTKRLHMPVLGEVKKISQLIEWIAGSNAAERLRVVQITAGMTFLDVFEGRINMDECIPQDILRLTEALIECETAAREFMVHNAIFKKNPKRTDELLLACVHLASLTANMYQYVLCGQDEYGYMPKLIAKWRKTFDAWRGLLTEDSPEWQHVLAKYAYGNELSGIEPTQPVLAVVYLVDLEGSLRSKST